MQASKVKLPNRAALLRAGVSRKMDPIMEPYAKLVQQLHSSNRLKQQQTVAALSGIPLTPRAWLLLAGAIPRLAQLLHSSSTTAALDRAIRKLLQHITSSAEYLTGGGYDAAPDGIIPPLVSLLLLDDDTHVCHAAAVTLFSLTANVDNRIKVIEAGAIAPLVQLLGSDSEVLHNPAAQALAHLAKDDPGAQARILAAGAMGPLLGLLSSGAAAVQQSAAMAFSILADDPVAAASGIPLLVQLLKSPSAAVHQEVAQALSRLAPNTDIVTHIVADGAIPLLVGLLIRPSGPYPEVLQQYVAVALGDLAFSAQSEIIAAGAIEALVGLLESSDWVILQLPVTCALVNLSSRNAAGQARIAAAGAIVPLVRLLRETIYAELQEKAVTVLANLTRNDAGAVVRAGAIPLLVERLMDEWNPAAHGPAARALRTLAKDVDFHAAILAAAPLLPLVHLLASSSEKTQGHAQKMLVYLSDTPTFSKQFVAAGAIPPLVHLLRSDSSLVQQQAVSILGLLAEKGRSDILVHVESAGALPLLACLLQTSASSESMRLNVEKLLQALGTPPFNDPEKGSVSALQSNAASARPEPASRSAPATAATAPPVAASPQLQRLPPRPRKSCWTCGAMAMPLKRCAVCAVASYCGADCQKADWKAHKGQCVALKAGGVTEPS